MFKIYHYVFISFLFHLSIVIYGQEINAVALKNGCRIVKIPPTYFNSSDYSRQIDEWTWQGLIDEHSSIGWCSGVASKPPYTFVFELAEEFQLDKIVFNNYCQTESKGVCSKEVKLEYSVTSAVTGFISIDTITLKPYSIYKSGINPIKVRWIRLTILSNYGNSQWTELMEFEAWGTYSKPTVENAVFKGLWKKGNDYLTIATLKSNNLYGCYSWAHGIFTATFPNRRICTFNWKQKRDSLSGWGRFILNKEGTYLSVIWGLDGDSIQYGNDIFIASQAVPDPCLNEGDMNNMISAIEKPNPPKGLLTVMIEMLDEDSKEHIPGKIDVYTAQESIPVESPDGYYSTELPLAPFVIKTTIPDYFPSIDTIHITEEFSRGYVNRTIYLSRLAVGNNIVLDNILFTKGSFELLPNSNSELDALVYTMKKYPGMEIELSGHTDNQGDEDKNILLSEQRVRSVKDFLISKGIVAKRIDGIGYGGKYPIASNATEQSRKLNRRVELKIIRL